MITGAAQMDGGILVVAATVSLRKISSNDQLGLLLFTLLELFCEGWSYATNKGAYIAGQASGHPTTCGVSEQVRFSRR
jgi:hypothetical protein